MNKEFCTHDIALKLNKLGFNEPCLGLFSNYGDLIIKEIPNQEECLTYFGGVLAPLYQQAIIWLLKKLEFNYPYLEIKIFSDQSGSWYQPKDVGNDELDISFVDLEEAILKAIEIYEQTSINISHRIGT